MGDMEKEDIPMLLRGASFRLSDENTDVDPQRLTSRSASLSIPMYSVDLYNSENRFVSHSGPLQIERRITLTQMSGPLCTPRRSGKLVWPEDKLAGKNENLLKSGELGKCNDPYCTTCPTYYDIKAAQRKTTSRFESSFRNILSGDTKNWMTRLLSSICSRLPGIMNPHARKVQLWNKFFVIACLVAVFVDPLFFFLLRVHKENRCIVLNWPMATIIAAVRSVTDFIYLLHMLLQFRLAYVAPESRVVGAGELVDHPKKIALHYFYGKFGFDVFLVLPLPQIMILCILPKYVGSSAANYAKNLVRAAVLLQYIPRFFRFLPFLAGSSASGLIFETASANFVINLLIFILAAHVVGSCWYLFGLQRVNQCFRDVCNASEIRGVCKQFIDCGRGDIDFAKYSEWDIWKSNTNVTDCLNKDGSFDYGIYAEALKVTTQSSIVTRYIYSFFWGFQQISTVAGNQNPSVFEWEVLFTMAIMGLGLFLFALLIGNMNNYLQALGRRRSEMQLRHRDVERWMSHRRLPEELRRQVRESERFRWAATRGVNEEMLLEDFPEDLQRDIRRHQFSFIKKVQIFALMPEPIFDAIGERLRQKLYIKDSKILYPGSAIDMILFIVRGKMVSVDATGYTTPLSDGDICCEELLAWSLDHSPVPRGSLNGHRPVSNRTVTCLTNVEAFSLSHSDMEEVTALFPREFRSLRVQGAIRLFSLHFIYMNTLEWALINLVNFHDRYVSPYWRELATIRIQKYWKKHRSREVQNFSYIV
ncbi:hypothetical protein ACHQM5_005332 [Ranunculus cassubicifolius]